VIHASAGHVKKDPGEGVVVAGAPTAFAAPAFSPRGSGAGGALQGLPGRRLGDTSALAMRENIRLVSSAGTGFAYYTTKNKRTQTNKLELKKYDPVARQHVVFKEAKMPPHSK